MRRARLILCFTLLCVISILSWQPALGRGDAAVTPTPPAASKVACTEISGKVQSLTIPTTLLHKDIPVRVYTPPCYDPTGHTKYPVLYLLHGQSYKEDQWIRLGVPEAADRLIRDGQIQPLLIIMPGEVAYLEDMRTSKFGQAVLEEVIPWVEEKYPAIQDRTGRVIGGLSRGSGWAMHLALSRPELFSSVGAHSLTQMSGDSFAVPKWRRNTSEELLPRIYIDIGLQDHYKDTAKSFELRLSEYSYPHEWHLNRGTHNEEYWSSHVEEYLRWYDSGWVE